jgi:hypothetical protein
MKNNHALLNTTGALLITRNLGDPELFAGVIRDMQDLGESEIIQLNLSNPAACEIYAELKNNPDRYQVVQETDFGGRDKIMVVLRYMRKGPWKPDLSRMRSLEESEKDSKKPRKPRSTEPKQKKVAGFMAGVKPAKPAKKGKKK